MKSPAAMAKALFETYKIKAEGIKLDIQYSRQAEKFLKRQDEFTKNRIIRAIHRLPAGDVKKLRGSDYYRLRVGAFRIIFDREGNILYVIKIDLRGDVYKQEV